MARSVWIGDNEPSSGWESSSTPMAVSEVTRVDDVALGYDIQTDGGEVNGLEVILLMAQSASWPRRGVYVHEADANLRAMMSDALARFAPERLGIFESDDNGETWIPIQR